MTGSQRWQRAAWCTLRATGALRIIAGGVAAGALAVVAPCLAAAPALADPSCAKFAAEPGKGGSDGNTGDEAHPYATLGKLASSLSAGQTGCIFSGQTIDVHRPQSLRNASHGTEGAPITITSTNPAEPATVTSSLAVEGGSDWMNFTHLRFWWSQPPPYTCWDAQGNSTDRACNGEPQNPEDNVQIAISASHTAWLYDDIQNFNTDICMNVVSYAGSTAHETLIEHDRIHDCGQRFTGEAASVNEEAAWHDHGVYDYGVGTKILNNYIYSNSRNGVLFYGGGRGGVAEHNIIDENGNGITFGNTVDSTARWNIITNNSLDDKGRCAPRGCDDFGVAVNGASGDSFEHNCLANNLSGEIEFATREPARLLGVLLGANLLRADPLYENAAERDYTLSPGSPCLGYGPDTAQPTGAPPTGPAPRNIGLPAVLVPTPGGQPLVGQPVTALPGSWTGAPTGYSYQWNACAVSPCTPIAGATEATYTPTAPYAGDTLTVTVTATDADGSASATSPESAPLLFEGGSVTGRPSGVLSGESLKFVTQSLSGGLIVTTPRLDAAPWQSELIGDGAWSTSVAPSATVGPNGAVWIAFAGPGHSLWVSVEQPGGSGPAIAYEGPSGTTYSAPSLASDSGGNVWVAAEGPNGELIVTERAVDTGAWTSSAVTAAERVYSAPSVAVDPAGDVWIAFQGPEHSLLVVTDWLSVGGWWTVYDGSREATYSEPSTAIDSGGNVWVAAEGPSNALQLIERVALDGSWRPALFTDSARVYSAPDAIANSAGNVWIAFQGPGHSLWLATAWAETRALGILYEGQEGRIYSAPSEVIGSNGELWVGYQRGDNRLGVLERPLAGLLRESGAGGLIAAAEQPGG